MADNANVRWNKQRRQWCVVVSWQGKYYYFSKYLGRIRTGTDPNRRCQVADRIAADINSEIDKGIFNPARHKNKKPLHLKKYSDNWIKNISVEESTRRNYQGYFNNHILPVLGDIYLADINFDRLRALQNGMALGNKAKKNAMGALHALMADAKRSGHIKQLPEFPGFKGLDAIEQKVPEWISQEDQAAVLNEIDSRDRYVFRFLFATGCRPSEALASPDFICASDMFNRFQSGRCAVVAFYKIVYQSSNSFGSRHAFLKTQHFKNLPIVNVNVSCMYSHCIFSGHYLGPPN